MSILANGIVGFSCLRAHTRKLSVCSHTCVPIWVKVLSHFSSTQVLSLLAELQGCGWGPITLSHTYMVRGLELPMELLRRF